MFWKFLYITQFIIIKMIISYSNNDKKIRLFLFQTTLGRSFWRAVGEVVKSNANMDFLISTRSDPVYHFDSERVEGATFMLRQFWVQTLFSVRAKEYQNARHSLGQLFHSLQVHSNTAHTTD